MKNKLKTFMAFFVLAIMLSSCATIISGQKQMVAFSTEPSGAEIRIDGRTIGTTPMTTKIKRTTHAVKFQKEGYRDSDYFFNKKFNGWYLGNILLGGLPGMIVDLCVGSYVNTDDNVYQKMEKK